MTDTAAEAVIAALDLAPHPEGGHFREVYRHAPPDGGRGDCTSIYYLLRAGERSAWHRVRDAVEIWQFHAGDPLTLMVSEDGKSVATHLLGADLAAGARPQAVVPAGAWQSAKPRGDWTLVGCTVAPAFSFEAFEMAPDRWRPG